MPPPPSAEATKHKNRKFDFYCKFPKLKETTKPKYLQMLTYIFAFTCILCKDQLTRNNCKINR